MLEVVKKDYNTGEEYFIKEFENGLQVKKFILENLDKLMAEIYEECDRLDDEYYGRRGKKRDLIARDVKRDIIVGSLSRVDDKELETGWKNFFLTKTVRASCRGKSIFIREVASVEQAQKYLKEFYEKENREREKAYYEYLIESEALKELNDNEINWLVTKCQRGSFIRFIFDSGDLFCDSEPGITGRYRKHEKQFEEFLKRKGYDEKYVEDMFYLDYMPDWD